MLATLWCCCACWLVFHDVYSMVLLCMLPGVLCWLLYGVAVHVGWCSMMSTLWCCCACWLVFYMLATLWCCCACCLVFYSMVLLCMLPGVLCWLLYGVAVHVGWCSMMSTLWCCCACCLVFYVGYSMVLLCMLAGVP